MRDSSNAPAMSRRSMMRGLAFALAGASVPVAAIAGATARKLMTGDDTELLNRCQLWKDQSRKLKRMEKGLLRLANEADARTPPKPRELFEPIQPSEHLPLYHPEKLLESRDGSWPRERLVRWIERPFNPKTTPIVGPTPECRAHCQKLLGLLDEYEANYARIWAAYGRLEKQWERQSDKQWRLFLQIIQAKAETLQGIAAQFEVLERHWYPIHSNSPKVDAAIPKMMANVRRLVAAQMAGV